MPEILLQNQQRQEAFQAHGKIAAEHRGQPAKSVRQGLAQTTDRATTMI